MIALSNYIEMFKVLG